MNPLSKAKVKFFASLKQKKFRYEHGLLIIEGRKLLEEALKEGVKPTVVILLEGFENINGKVLDDISEEIIFQTDLASFTRLSSQISPEGILAILPFPVFAGEIEVSGPAFVLDNVRDPGNLGTLIRTADWFGFNGIVCSKGTADWTNPKVLRSAMGSVFRMPILYVEDLVCWLTAGAENVVVADMEGEKANAFSWQGKELIVLGNEANGVSDEIRQIDGLNKVTISRSGKAESLNVAAAGAVLGFLCAGKG